MPRTSKVIMQELQKISKLIEAGNYKIAWSTLFNSLEGNFDDFPYMSIQHVRKQSTDLYGDIYVDLPSEGIQLRGPEDIKNNKNKVLKAIGDSINKEGDWVKENIKRLKKTIMKIVQEEIEVNQTYQVEHYDAWGQTTMDGSYPNFNTAYSRAILKKNKLTTDNDCWYIGVCGGANEKEFAVVYIKKEYLDNRFSVHDFPDVSHCNAWKEVAEKCLATGKPQIGEYK